MLNFHILTIFPGFFESPLATSLLARAQAAMLVGFSFHNPRDYAKDRHRTVDDAPYGGGAGMVMRGQPIADALNAIPIPGRILSLTPSGRPLTADLARELAGETDITLICGRYEGMDARIAGMFPLEEISIGDMVLNGGETAALAVIESVSRFVPGFLGKDESAEDESFANGLLEYPQYTRPEVLAGLPAPEILLSGHHARIKAWRREKSLEKTLRLRPDLLDMAHLGKKDAEKLAAIPRLCPGRNLSFCLFHYPVKLENRRVGVSSLTNLDIHDIARVSRSYGMGPFYVLTPLEDQLLLLRRILTHWLHGHDKDRCRALELVRPVASFEEMDRQAQALHGVRPAYVAASAQWPPGKKTALTPHDIGEILSGRPVVLCLGTARGLADSVLEQCDGQLRPLRFLSDNHLSVRGAAAIMADRILGDFR